jgi:hypothetical protein
MPVYPWSPPDRPRCRNRQGDGRARLLEDRSVIARVKGAMQRELGASEGHSQACVRDGVFISPNSIRADSDPGQIAGIPLTIMAWR